MKERTRQYACLGLAVLLVITGTVATGLLPSTVLYQVFAGSVVVAGFAVSFVCLGGFEFLERIE